jgi:cytochrome c-type biogenesis protein
MGLGSLALSYIAGALSTLSPCVLPLLPILLASAVQQHVLGPLALALGLAVSFSGMGLFVASMGLNLGIDASTLRFAAAILMLALGVVLLVPALQAELTQRVGPLSSWAGRLLERLPSNGAGAQFLLGLVLGVVWSPCAGPTLGAAIGLAAQRETMVQAMAVMVIFGFGAATPALALAYGSRQVALRRRDRLRRLSAVAKPII